ncbi:related to integral membrane protein PTH11 [Rhynchosporium secalis]|uniref:Related to integral membrane protein PTH11 n=1 Tax=Rhynchosporium secalis TaxID=38038 RepID=A0A1E1MET5_RHYSE|nr:related to integral membrane protein PTH11 [Rhynchosporium secalis]
MDIFRRLAVEAPDIQTFRDSKPTLLVSWWCTAYALAVIFLRFCGRYVRAEKVFLEDGVMVMAITPLLVRMAFAHAVLVYGTNNTKTDGLLEKSIQNRKIGSQLVLVSRVFYAAYLWAIKYSTSVFLRTLTDGIWQRSHQRLLRYLHTFLIITFIATVVSNLSACHPFHHYWQVIPDPGPQCRQGYAHLITTGALNIITNLAIIIFPIPMILNSRLPRAQKISIMLRLSLPILSIALTLYQIPRVIEHRGEQSFRSLVASFDILLATFTSNAIVLVSLLQDRGYKKSKYKVQPSTYENRDLLMKVPTGRGGPRPSRWGSDEDLISVGKASTGATAMEVFSSSSLRGKAGAELGIESGRSRSRARSRSSAVLEEPAKAILQEIRVEETWQITVEGNVKDSGVTLHRD